MQFYIKIFQKFRGKMQENPKKMHRFAYKFCQFTGTYSLAYFQVVLATKNAEECSIWRLECKNFCIVKHELAERF